MINSVISLHGVLDISYASKVPVSFQYVNVILFPPIKNTVKATYSLSLGDFDTDL